ncbi:MAG: hypothetical protein R3D33_14310 [Hyphomicrobiaceae bacterium]
MPVKSIATRSGRMPAVDLQSVRITLEYIHSDVKQVGALKNVASALEAALAELDRVRGGAADPRFERLIGLPEGRLLR